MTKLFAIALIISYSVTSFGMKLDLNYCCGKLSKVAFSLSQAENSKQNNQLENKKCCGHKEVNFKLKTDHQSNVYKVIDFSIQTVALPVFFNVDSNINSSNTTVTQHSNGPPLYSPSDLFIKHCSLRI